MAERPILFSGPMVRAILDGRKTQTRRMLNPQPPEGTTIITPGHSCGRAAFDEAAYGYAVTVPYAPGDLLWVRETWADSTNNRGPIYRADGESLIRWKSPIHMPRRLSRITLRVTDVRVQRLQEITSADAIAEGFSAYANSQTIDCDTPDPREDFRNFWDSLNAKRPECSWQGNPWVCAISFERSATNG